MILFSFVCECTRFNFYLYGGPYFVFNVAWFFGLYGISTFVGYLTPNLFLCK